MTAILALSWPSPWVLLVIVGAILLLYGIFAPQKRGITSAAPVRPLPPAPEQLRVQPASANGVDAVPHEAYAATTIDEDEIELGPVVAHPPSPSWPTLIDERQNALDAATRRSIILGLGALAQPWCAPILERAYNEEATLEMRSTVLGAVRDGRYAELCGVLERALHAANDQERVLAVEGLGAIGRWDDLKSALGDPSLGVATAAAYQLLRARGFEETSTMIAQAGGEHAEELAGIMAIFA